MSQYVKPNINKLQSTIKHIVVLMLENRSFDNLLGWLYAGKTPPYGQQYEGLNESMWNPLNNIDADGNPFIEKVPVAKNGYPSTVYTKAHVAVPNPVDFTLPNPDPGEGFRDTNYQLFHKYKVAEAYTPAPVNTGFVDNYQSAMLYGTYTFGDRPNDPRTIMKCYTPEQTPVLSELARSFAVCDQYYCSIPSQTLPNRDFVHAATSTGFVNNSPVANCNAYTVYNVIQDAIDAGRKDLSWGIFSDNLYDPKKKDDLEGKFGKDHFSLTRVIMTKLYDSRFDDNFGTIEDFKSKCQSGELPSYTFLEPNYGGPKQNDQHPPSDIRPGEQLIADMYNAIRNSPAFEQTLFVITYDEHGGCYDHFPPAGGAKNPDITNTAGQDGFNFTRFGVRVPCVVVNPYIMPGLIPRPDSKAYNYTPFDHTSIIKTVYQCFGLQGNLTERDKAAPDFSGLLTLDAPRKTDIPVVTPLQWNPTAVTGDVNELHRLIGKVMGDLTGTEVPESADLLEYIQQSYNSFFNTGTTSNKKA